jgi:Tfp pilus assembly protein PilO
VDKLKQWVALTVVGVLAVLAAGWFLVVSPKRSAAADLRNDAASQQQSNLGLQAQHATLKAQAKDLPKKQAALAAVAAKVPDNPALPALIRSLSKAADDAGVELVSLSPTAPVPATGGPAAAQPQPAAGGKTTLASGAASSAAGTLQQIALTINVIGGYFQVEQFFDRLENLSRALKVGGFTMLPGTSPTKPVDPMATVTVATDPGKVLNTQVNALVYMSSNRAPVPAAPVAAK